MQDNSEKKKNRRFHRTKELIKRFGLAVLSGILGAGLIVAVILGLRMRAARNEAQQQLRDSYINSFNIAGGQMHTINTDLIKLRVTTSPAEQSVLLYTVWRDAGQAQLGLSQLPVDTQSSSSMLQFVNRLGDYCYVLAKGVNQGSGITDAQFATLQTLESQSATVAQQIESLRDTGVNWQIVQAAWTSGGESPHIEGISQMSDSIQEYPALIYDGPYSDQSENIAPKAASGAEVSYEQAVAVAQRFLPGTYTQNADQGAQVPTYSMTCTSVGGVQNVVQVTKKAGLIYAILPNGATATDVYPTKDQVPELIGIAKSYLEQRGFPTMQSAYAQFYEGAAVINMVPVQDGVLLYPDLVKVWVDISTKQVIGLNANNYVVSHTTRTFPINLVDKQQLTDRVAKRLTVEDVRLALIPYNTLEERLCYEFTGKNGNDTFAIFVSAETGEELDIKLIVDADDGTFTY